MQYRFDLFLWMTVEAMTPLISLAVWYRVAQSSSRFLTPQDTVTYYILVIFVMIITNAWSGFFFAREILNGDIVKFLTRPVSVVWHHVTNNIVEKSIKLIIPVPLLLASLLIFPHFFSPSLYQFEHIALFIPSLLLAAIVSFMLDMVFGVVAFWLENADQIRRYRDVLQEVTSGVLIPLAVLPPAVFTLFSFLPFRYIISGPIEILMGQVEGTAAWTLLGYQLAWVVVLGGLFMVLFQRGLQRYAVPGQ